jgi:hypothetical protein
VGHLGINGVTTLTLNHCHNSSLVIGSNVNRPLSPRAIEVEFFPIEEVLREKVKIHR